MDEIREKEIVSEVKAHVETIVELAEKILVLLKEEKPDLRKIRKKFNIIASFAKSEGEGIADELLT